MKDDHLQFIGGIVLMLAGASAQYFGLPCAGALMLLIGAICIFSA